MDPSGCPEEAADPEWEHKNGNQGDCLFGVPPRAPSKFLEARFAMPSQVRFRLLKNAVSKQGARA